METAGSVQIQITGNIAPFEAALAKAQQQAVAFDAKISAQLNGAGLSEGLAKIAAGVDVTNALLTKLTTSGTAAGAALAKVGAATTTTAAALSKVAVATKAVNAEMASISSGGSAGLAAGTVAAKDFAAALEATGGNLSKITPAMVGLATETEAVAAASQSAAIGMVELGVAEKEAAGLGAGVSREFSVLGGEVLRGNFSRIPGSLLVMNERLASTGAGVLTLSNGMKALGSLGAVIFNPFVLGFLAVTVGLEAATRAFSSMSGDVKDVNAILEGHKKLLEEIAGSYPHLTEELKKYEEAAKLLPQSVVANDAVKQIDDDQKALEKSLNGIVGTLRLAQASSDAVGTAGAQAFGTLADEIEAGSIHADDLARSLVNLHIDPTLNDTAKGIAQDLVGAAKEAIVLQNTLDSDRGIKSISIDGQKASKTLYDVSSGFKEVQAKAGNADATIAKLFGTLDAGGGDGYGVTRSLGTQLQSTLGMFEQIGQAVQNSRQDQLAGMVQLEAQFRATTARVDELKQAIASAGGKDNIRDFFGDVSNIKNANAEIENSVATVQKLFAAMATGNTSVNAVSQGLEMVRQTLINDGFPVDKIDVFLNRLVQANRELVADQSQVHQLGAAINALHDRTITITVQTRQVGSGLQSSYQVPTTYGGAESAGTGSSYGVSGSSNVNVTRFSSTDRQISQPPIFNTSTNSWGYVQPTTYQDPNVLAQVNAMYPARAAGGPIAANMPYWVGEHGPELVMPSSAGTVIPNAQSMALANPQSAFTGQVATSDANRMWTLQMNIEGNTRKTTQLLDEIKSASASTSSALGSSSYGGGSSSTGGTDSQNAAYMAALATAKANFRAAGIVGAGIAGYGIQGLNATPEQIAHRAVYGFNSGGMIAPGDSQEVKFFKSPDEAVAIFTPQQLKAIQGANQNQPAAANADGRPIVVNQTHNWNGNAPPSKDSIAEMRRQTALAVREALRSINGR